MPAISALERGVAGGLRQLDGTAVEIEEVALLCVVHAFGGAGDDVQFTLPEMAQYLWEFGFDDANVDTIFARARQLQYDGSPVIAEATSTSRDGVAHWKVRLAPTRWLVAGGFRRF